MYYKFVKKKSRGETALGTVYARVRENGSDKTYTTGLVISLSDWQRLRTGNYAQNEMLSGTPYSFARFALILGEIKAAFERGYGHDNAARLISDAKLMASRMAIGQERASKGAEIGEMLLVDYMKMYIEDLRMGVKMKKGTTERVSEKYITGLVTLMRLIVKYEAARACRLGMNSVTMDFQRDFMRWNFERGLRPNSICNFLSRLRTIMASAVERKLSFCTDCYCSEFVPKGEEVDHVYLTPEQINSMIDVNIDSLENICRLIENANLPAKDAERLTTRFKCIKTSIERMQHARDIFVVGCLTGQRISDYSRINNNMIVRLDGKEFIMLIQQKTRKKIYIPLDIRVKRILEKYGGMLPKMSASSINELIKLLAEIMGWTYEAKIDISRLGGKRKTRFCDLISTHTARRSFATNAYAAKVPISSIMAITGHSSEKTLRRYLKQQAEDKAVIAARDLEVLLKISRG